MLQWLCDLLNKIVYKIDANNLPKQEKKVVYIAKYELDAGVIIPSDINEAMTIAKETLTALNSVYATVAFKTYLAIKRDMLVDKMVSDNGEKNERIKGAIEAIDSVYGDLSRYSEAYRINAGVIRAV